jgi:uncharacterized membrane protein YqiK
MLEDSGMIVIIVFSIVAFGFIAMIVSWFRKANQGEAIVRTGMGGTKVSTSGIFVLPVIHKFEIMDITLKTIETDRKGKDGLICKDNIRADIKVNFFIQVNSVVEDIKEVAQSIGCKRASNQATLEALFDAKFSEALKTVGKKFDFIDLYNARDEFKAGILEVIGTDLNGYVLDDCAIDYLEQTPLSHLDEKNILDAEGIKKIIGITSQEKIKSNLIVRDQEKVIKKQDVEARETILELEKQLKETEEQQRREIETIKAREQAEIDKVREEEKQKSELARLSAMEEIEVSEQNKDRQVLVAQKNKDRTDAVESERVERDRQLEQTERQRIVELAQIEKEKAIEEEKRNIQEVIRERVIVEKAVVEEEEKIKDTQAFAQADREKQVVLTKAEQEAQENLVKQIKAAEAAKQAAEHKAKQLLIDAQAEQEAAGRKAEAIKIMAEAQAAEVAAKGMGEAKVIEAKAAAMERKGQSDAKIIELEALAQAKSSKEKGLVEAEVTKEQGLAEAEVIKEKGESDASVIQLRAKADEEQGLAQARVSKEKYEVDAEGIELKAEAMKKLDGVGKEHEEFKLRLEKDKEIALAEIDIQHKIAASQATVVSEALKSANIDIVGGEGQFFEQIVGAITKGKSVDRTVDNSKTITQMKDTFFDGNGGSSFKHNLKQFVEQFGMSSEDMKNMSLAQLLNKMANDSSTPDNKSAINDLLGTANIMGLANKTVGSLGLF